MTDFNRPELEARYRLFKQFALEDQQNYYQNTLRKFKSASKQVNRYRARFALFTGVSSALAGLIVQLAFVNGASCTVAPQPPICGTLGFVVVLLIIFSVLMPALGAFFNTLADLYQWDRSGTIYTSALQNLEVARAQSPIPEMDDPVYRASFKIYAEGTLQVMSDETAQWGQSIRTPAKLADFVAHMTEVTQKYDVTGDNSHQSASSEPKA